MTDRGIRTRHLWLLNSFDNRHKCIYHTRHQRLYSATHEVCASCAKFWKCILTPTIELKFFLEKIFSQWKIIRKRKSIAFETFLLKLGIQIQRRQKVEAKDKWMKEVIKQPLKHQFQLRIPICIPKFFNFTKKLKLSTNIRGSPTKIVGTFNFFPVHRSWKFSHILLAESFVK